MTEIVRLPERTRPRFTWLLPLVFAVGTVLGSVWGGHGGKLFFIGALAGIWACFLFGSGAEASAWLLPTLVGGLPVLVVLGLLLDRLRAEVRTWLLVLAVATVLVFYVLLQAHNDLDRAIEYHGSLLAYLVCSLQVGSYGATLVVLGLQAGRGQG